MAVVGALNQLVAGLHSGINAGFDYGEKGMKAYGGRKMGEAEAELAKYMEYDPAKPPSTGAVDAGEGGTDQPPQPTTRDLLSVRNELKEQYMAAARLANRSDPAAWREAEQHWAHQLQSGASSSLDKAISALDTGDWGTVERALNHANGLIPNALLTDVKVHDDGTITISGKDERTGEDVEEMTLTKKDLLELKVSMGDPAKALEIMDKKLQEAYQRTQNSIEQARNKEQDARQWAVDSSTIAKNKAGAQKDSAQARLYERTPGGATEQGARTLQYQRQIQNDDMKAVQLYTEGMNMSPNELEVLTSFGGSHAIQALAAYERSNGRDGNAPPMTVAQKAADTFMMYVERKQAGVDNEFTRAIEQIIGKRQGIPEG